MSKSQSDYPKIIGFSDKVALPPPGKPPRRLLLVSLVVAGLLGLAGTWWWMRKGDLPVEGPGAPPAVAKSGTEEKKIPAEPEIPDLPVVPPTPPDAGGDGPERPACFGGTRVVVQAPAYALEYLGKTAKRLRVGTNDWTTVRALPHTLPRQPCGLVDMGLEAAGFEVKPPVHPVLIQEGRTNEVSFTVTAKPAALTLTCNVTNAVVELQGKKTPVGGTLSVPSLQALALTITAPAYRRQTVNLGPYDPLSTHPVVVTLEREAGTLVIEAEAPPLAADYLKTAAKRVKIASGAWTPVSALPHTVTNLTCVATPVELEVEGFGITGGAPAAPVVRDGQSTAVKFTLAPKPALLLLTCNVTNAVVEIAGQKTPLGGTLPVPALSPLDLTVSAPGHVPQVLKLGPMDPGKPCRQEVKLVPEAAAAAVPATPGQERKSPGGIDFVFIPPGTFQMGSPADERDREKDETQHRVTLTKGYWLGKTEVTQGQWQAVMGNNPSEFKGANLPVEYVSWEDCQSFVQKLCEKEGVPQGTYRLPTEAEWEYACRAGTTGAYAGNLDELGWYNLNSGNKTRPVGQKKPNGWGLHDMSGNVKEWCLDVYNDYPSVEVSDPMASDSGPFRISRGGAWCNAAVACRSAYRLSFSPERRGNDLGFRLVRMNSSFPVARPPGDSVSPSPAGANDGSTTGSPERPVSIPPKPARKPALVAGAEWVSPATGVAFKRIAGGDFTMGSPADEHGRDEDETQHQVTLSNDFWLGKTEITQKQWRAVMGSNPSRFKGDDLPVENVSWDDCQEFIKKLCEKEGVAQGTYRLPTEAEWEHACRAGTTGAYAGNLDEMAWTGVNSGGKTHPVSQKKPNAWGLYDMHGNVWEWCQDCYGSYPAGKVSDPVGPAGGSHRINRGGSWSYNDLLCRSAVRCWDEPVQRADYLGFRLLKVE